MPTALQGPDGRAGAPPAGRLLLLREVATSPVAALFVAERPTEHGAYLAAVKVLKQPMDPSLVVGLQEAAARLGTLRHRHIVAPDEVLDIDGHLGIVSPYIDGVDLLDWLEVLRETNTPMPPRVVCEVLRGVAVALEAALNRVPWGETRPLRMVHADLKPGNVMIDRDGELHVLDFGTGSSRLTGAEAPSRNARAYVAPERRLGRPPTHQGDIYALGLLGIELLQNAWLRQIPPANPDHDLHLGQVVRHLDLGMRSAADEQTLRSLLLRMCAYNPASRPTAAGAAQTLRRLADRAPGPSLESFAHEHALPWLTHTPEDPDTALMVQATPLAVDVTGRFPVLAPDPPSQTGAEDETHTNTMNDGRLGRLLERDDPSHVFLRGAAWDDEASLTESIANETAAALRGSRAQHGSTLAPTEPLELGALHDPADPTDLIGNTSLGAVALEDLELARAASFADAFDPVTLASYTGLPELPAPAPVTRIVLPLIAMLTGAAIAAGAVLIGLVVGAAIALAS